MGTQKYYLAIDLGDTAGKFTAGEIIGEHINTFDLGSFKIHPITENGKLFWDLEAIYKNIKEGVSRAVSIFKEDLVSMGISSWGTDFGLLGQDGKLLQNPLCYYEQRHPNLASALDVLISPFELYRRIGSRPALCSSLYQLLAIKKNDPELLASTDTLLSISDLINYRLTGIKAMDRTMAANTDLYKANDPAWQKELIETLGLPLNIFPEIKLPGTVLGSIQNSVKEELGISHSLKIVLPGCHDSACAIASIPNDGRNYALMYSGSWSSLGTVVRDPIVTFLAMDKKFENQCNTHGRTNLLRVTRTIWIVTQCQIAWAEDDGYELDFYTLSDMARQGTPFVAVIDILDPIFGVAENMPKRVQDYCRKTGQRIPQTREDILRVLIEGIALWYRKTIEELEELTGERIYCMSVAGGGSSVFTLNQFAANATGRRVMAGPVKAKAYGNLIMQMIAMGDISTIVEAKRFVKNSIMQICHDPDGTAGWDDAYRKLKQLRQKNNA